MPKLPRISSKEAIRTTEKEQIQQWIKYANTR